MRWARVGIIIFWLVMVALLLVRHYGGHPRDRISFATVKGSLDVGEEWMGVYFKGEKVGYAVTVTRRVGDKYEILEHSVMRMSMLGEKQRVESKLKSRVNVDYSLESFEFSLVSGEATFALHGEMAGKTLKLRMITEKSKSETTIPVKEVPFVSNALKSYVFQQGLTVGKKYRLPFFDPSTMSTSDILIEVGEKEDLNVEGKQVAAYRLEESFQGIETRAWIDERGETIKEESPMGFTLVREGRERAVSGGWAEGTSPDLVAMSAVTVDKPIPNARQSQHLAVKLLGVSLAGFDLEGGRQRFKGDVLTIMREAVANLQNYTLPYEQRGFEPFLQPTPLIQSGHERIRSTAKDIIKTTTDAKTAVKMLLDWVYANLEKKPFMSIPSSLDVLNRKSGDCNEHTSLFTALARSIGIPTRVCVGLVYMENGFYYHAWPEVFLGDWVAVDPTFNQFPADATHLRFVIGDLGDQVRILGIVGKLRVQVLESS